MKTNEQETSDPIEITRSLKKFYSSLYTRRSNKTEDECIASLRNINIPKLTDDERNVCEGKLSKMKSGMLLTQWETTKALGMMDCQKNFMSAFFKKFTLTFLMHLTFLLPMGNYLSNSQCQAVITLIEKKGKDKRFLKNWTSISIINVDAKVASKSLASKS